VPVRQADDYAELSRRLLAARTAEQRDGLLDLWLELKRLDDPTGPGPWPDVREATL